MEKIPKAFISYSHDTQEHKKWVLELATRLRNNGIDAIIDQYELQPGDDIPYFMETHLESSEKILMICTEKYVEKANKGVGGVGYEKMIVTSSLLEGIDQNKVIPIIRQKGDNKTPTFLKSKLFVNFSNDDDFEFSYDELVRAIHGTPLFKKPAVGDNPFKPIEKEKLTGDIDLLHIIIKGIIKTYKNDGGYTTVSSIALNLNISKILVEIGIDKLNDFKYISVSPSFLSSDEIRLTKLGRFYAYENDLLK